MTEQWQIEEWDKLEIEPLARRYFEARARLAQQREDDGSLGQRISELEQELRRLRDERDSADWNRQETQRAYDELDEYLSRRATR